CAHVRAGVGAVASQNITDPALGPLLLDELAKGMPADRALHSITEGRQHIDYRQLLVIDALGRTAIHSGRQVLGIWAEAQGKDCASGGNLLANPGIPAAMIAGFETAKGHLGDRLIAALKAGLAAGGEAGPVHSAGLKIADKLDWPLVDLRIDWSDSPIEALETAWEIYRPQMVAYVQRAQDPTEAPSYGVPGDE
ncbi:MAG: hypothetical protein ACD_54C01132G0001, partial [uncultured bacterium]